MGCGSSKKVLGANSLQKKQNRPFPLVLEDLLLTNSHDQFVALICKTNDVAKKFASTESENTLPFISKDNEGERLVSVETHARVNLDLELASLLTERISEKCKDAEGESEGNKPEDNKTEIINTWELMEGLDDEEACRASKKIETDRDIVSSNSRDICEELIDKNPPRRISWRSKSSESFHKVEEYDVIHARSKRPQWDRNSKMHLYYLGHDHLNIFKSTSLNWKEDSKDEDDCTQEFSVLRPSFQPRDAKDDASSQEYNDIQLTISENNNGIAETLSRKNGNQENNQSVKVNIGDTDMVDRNSEIGQSTDMKSSKTRMQERAKVNVLGSIIIPTTPDFSAVGSLREWLHDGGHLYSPGEITIPRFRCSEIGDKWSKLNAASSSGQLSREEAKLKTCASPVSAADDTLANNGELSIYSDSGDSVIEHIQYDHPPFDPDLLASLEKDLEQLSEEEQHLLRQIDEDSEMPSGMLYTEDNEDGLQDSSGTENTHLNYTCVYSKDEFSIQAPWVLEIPQKVLATAPSKNYLSAFHILTLNS